MFPVVDMYISLLLLFYFFVFVFLFLLQLLCTLDHRFLFWLFSVVSLVNLQNHLVCFLWKVASVLCFVSIFNFIFFCSILEILSSNTLCFCCCYLIFAMIWSVTSPFCTMPVPIQVFSHWQQQRVNNLGKSSIYMLCFYFYILCAYVTLFGSFAIKRSRSVLAFVFYIYVVLPSLSSRYIDILQAP